MCLLDGTDAVGLTKHNVDPGRETVITKSSILNVIWSDGEEWSLN